MVFPINRGELRFFRLISFGRIPYSSFRMLTILGRQKPPWHRPIPALVRYFTAAMVLAEKGLFIAFRTSRLDTCSHLHTISPYVGSCLIRAACLFLVGSRNGIVLFLIGLKSVFSFRSFLFLII